MKSDLTKLWKRSLGAVDPKALITEPMLGSDRDSAAVLCWGKAALRTWETIGGGGRRETDVSRYPGLIISPRVPAASRLSNCRWVQGDHPLPGEGSFAAGEAILDFFDSLRRNQVRRLIVFLSGGASSLAWIPPGGMRVGELQSRLRSLYSRQLSIRELNSARSRLCALKGGGAATWLRRLAPGVRVRVEVISDVEPFGPGVVGSGPFWSNRGERVPHRVLAGNSSWVKAIAAESKRLGLPVLSRESGRIGTWKNWVEDVSSRARKALERGAEGLVIYGGEPSVGLPSEAAPGARGGRQSQVAAALALALYDEIEAGKIEFLCASSDGVDGGSGSAGSIVDRAILRNLGRNARRELARSVEAFETGEVLASAGALIPEGFTGTNVQDAIFLRVRR